MKRTICPSCGTAQPNARKFCVSCGEKLDNDTEEFIDRQLYFVKKPWMNIAAAVFLAFAAGELALICRFGNEYQVWIPFAALVAFAVCGVVFFFPAGTYKILCYISAFGGRYSCHCHQCFEDRLAEDADDPYPEHIRVLLIVFAVFAVLALMSTVYFLARMNDFEIVPEWTPEDILNGTITVTYQ